MEQLAIGFETLDATMVFKIIKSIIKEAGYDTDTSVAKDDGREEPLLSLKPLEDKTMHSVKVIDNLACSIALKPKGRYLQVKYRYRSTIIENGIPYTFIPSQEGTYIRLPFSCTDDIIKMRPVILEAFEVSYAQNAGASYGCCHRFVACSDAKKCIHPDHLFALGCLYRKNLEAGRIFYGKNANI